MDVFKHNQRAWDALVERGFEWTVPVSPEVVRAARLGQWQIVLTPLRPVPREWFPPLAGTRTLCLAGAGGQQGPVLAAAGAKVTVFDASARQLAQDRLVAERESLSIETIQGDMKDLRVFDDGSFDLVVHPCSNCFVPDVAAVWGEVFRVLRPGGVLLSGFVNPAFFMFDDAASDRGELLVRHRLPYSDLASLTEEEQQAIVRAEEPFVFGHSLEDLIGGQTKAGFAIVGLYEDDWPGKPLSKFMAPLVATRALKPTVDRSFG
jgi:SAM-dependent methyltransferase